MESIRDRIERTPRRLARVMDLGIVVCLGIGQAWLWLGPLDMAGTGIVALGAFLTAAGAFIILHAVGIWCPRCGRRLERYYRGQFLRLSGRPSCPHCRLDFDQPAG